MADEGVAAKVRGTGLLAVLKKRWRAWLRSFHRDFGYLAIGFTVIYAVSGIAQNHIEDWGEVSYRTYEATKTIAAIADEIPDAEAIAKVTALVALGTPTTTFRAGDEIRLEYANGAKVTVIGSQVTIQGRERRAFIGVANWLHTARHKKGWKYVADAYAVLLLYLAISGIFMIKGRLGLKWRGSILIGIGVAVPVTAVLMSGPDARKAPPSAPLIEAKPADNGIKLLPPDEEEAPAQMPVRKEPQPADDGTAKDTEGTPPPVLKPPPTTVPGGSNDCDPFDAMHGCKKLTR